MSQLVGWDSRAAVGHFDLGVVKNIVHQADQRLGGGLDGGEKLTLFLGCPGFKGHPGHADDRIDRCADLVAHPGQEEALGPIGRLHFLKGRTQFILCPLQFFRFAVEAGLGFQTGVHRKLQLPFQVFKFAVHYSPVEAGGPPVRGPHHGMARGRVATPPDFFSGNNGPVLTPVRPNTGRPRTSPRPGNPPRLDTPADRP